MAQLSFTLSQEQYEALIALAREGTKDAEGQVQQDKAVNLDAFLRTIEKENGVERSAVWVQWQEMGQPLPAGTNFPSVWPPTMRVYIEFVTKQVARSDVDEALRQNATAPTAVLVTRDPGATCGWTEFDKFFR